MAKTKAPSLAGWGKKLKRASTACSVFDLPTSRKAVADLRLYLAMCVAGHLRWNVSQYADSRLRQAWGITMTSRGLLNWINQDETCRDLLAYWRSNGPKTNLVASMLVEAEKEAKRGEA